MMEPVQKKRVLVLGSGGREHALVKHFLTYGHQVFCSPGSDGIALDAPCFKFEDFQELARIVSEKQIELVVVGPENYLAAGVADDLEKKGIFVFGPTKTVAQLETDKAFAKDFLIENSIPTAQSRTITKADQLELALSKFQAPYVVKASGLAQGKGVWIGHSLPEAAQVGTEFLKTHSSLVIEEFLGGLELSAFYLVDGNHSIYLGSAQDHKRLLDSDQGPNTGGMGAISPSPLESEALRKKIEDQILKPTLAGLKKRNLSYRGFMFLGLMLCGKSHEPYMLEYNCRMGDPETQCLLQRLDEDLLAAIVNLKASGGPRALRMKDGLSLTVVVASKGYPENPQTGFELGSLKCPTDLSLIHSGTSRIDSKWIAKGGRLFSVNSLQSNYELAKEKVYRWLLNDSDLPKDKVHFRKDIGGSAHEFSQSL